MTFRERIRRAYANLTQGQKKLADYILKNPQKFAVQSAADTGASNGVSETTVIRLCLALNYSGFSEMRRDVQKELLAQHSTVFHYREKARILSDATHPAARIIAQDIERIQAMAMGLPEKTFDQVVDQLTRTENILIVGLSASYGIACWLSFLLNLVRGNTHLYHPDTDDIAPLAVRLDASWTMVVISFPRYSRQAVKLARLAQENKIPLVAITDYELSPVGRCAQWVLPVPGPAGFTLDTVSATFVLLNALVTALTIRDQERATKRLEVYENLRLKFDQFIER